MIRDRKLVARRAATAILAGWIVTSLACLQAAEKKSEKTQLRGIMFTGGCCHDYARQKVILADGIGRRTAIQWKIVHEGGSGTRHKYAIFDQEGWEKDYDVVLYNMCFAATSDEDYIGRILRAHQAGMPAVVTHCTMHTFRDIKSDMWREFLGVTSRRHGAKFPILVHTVQPKHPIMQGLPKEWRTPQGELYHILKVWPTATVLCQGGKQNPLGNDSHPCVWVNEYGKARVFGTTLGHHNETMQDPLYLDLISRGTLWTMDKLDDEHFRQVSPEEEAAAQKAAQQKVDQGNGKKPTPAKPAAKTQGKATGKTIRVPVNLAHDKPTSASATQGGRDAHYAVDEDPNTRWCAPDNNAGFWWQVDLGQPTEVTGCRITWEFDGRRYRYRIEGSSDGNSWQELVDQTANESRVQIHEHKIEADNVRYVRITGTELESGAWMSFYEFEVFGAAMQDVAVSKVRKKKKTRSTPAATTGLLSQVRVPEGFRATVFAAPPQVHYPACVAVTPAGEVFVGIDQNGSLGKDPKRRQQIVRCVDQDGDGQADDVKVFADRVGSVRGLFCHEKTVWALHPPLLRAFYDDDGDGVADRNEVLVEGLGTDALKSRGADHCTNGFGVGIDGWLYIAVGDFGATRAVAKDGSEIQLMGGGVARVRPDGSELEIYACGVRNIYDVAVDPFLNTFARDNTNDGGGWNVRLHHMIATGHSGYPTLFTNFGDEIIQPLADFGGGSGTGALFVDEPSLPEGYEHALYTCDWGRNAIYIHALDAAGTSFQADQNSFVGIPRPTDLDVDASGRIYIASWRNGGFSYKGDDVGYVLQVTPEVEGAASGFPDLAALPDAALVQQLRSHSHVTRLHSQLELLKRGPKDAVVRGIEKVATSEHPLACRVAAIFTLKQLLGAGSHPFLSKLVGDAKVREFALRALADRRSELSGVSTEVFVKSLADENPRVRLQAAIGLGRLGDADAAPALLPLTADSDPLVAHAAIKALVQLRAVDACLAALDLGSESEVPGAVRVLQGLHKPEVVDGLIVRLQRARRPDARAQIFRALCRLYHQEAEWKGNWWGTRPNRDGPYYRLSKWSESQKIAEVLKYTLAAAEGDEAKELILQLNRHRVKLGDGGSQLFKLAEKDASLRPTALRLLRSAATVPPEALPLLKTIAMSAEEDLGLRAQALSLLVQSADGVEILDTVLSALAGVQSMENVPESLLLARDSFVYDARHAQQVSHFSRQATGADPARQELACMVLLALAGSQRVDAAGREEAIAAIAGLWNNEKVLVPLLRAVGRVRSGGHVGKVRKYLEDPRSEVEQAARYAAARLRLDKPSGGEANETLAAMDVDAVLSAIEKEPGEIDLGRHLFLKQSCVACHTVADGESLRGPPLLDIARRYSRREIAESILKPSAKIAQGFHGEWFEMTDGRTHDGFIVREGPGQVEILKGDGLRKVLPKTEIEARGQLKVSVMPKGLADNLTRRELASLLAYLESLKSP